jgi:hypothetical protein
MWRMANATTAITSRRARTQAAKWGDEVRGMRIQQGMTIQAAAIRAGVAWATWARIEAGDPRARLATLCDIGEAIGLDLVVQAYLGRQPGLRDTGQLEVAASLQSQAHASLKIELELRVGTRGESIDLVMFGTTEIVAIEIERMAADFQAQYRRADRKRGLLADLHRRPVRLVMAIEDTRRNRAAIEPHLALVAVTLPAGSREILRGIRTAEPLGRDGMLWVRRTS